MPQEQNELLQPKTITILGSTGTIGQNTLDLIERNPSQFQVVALTGNQNISELVCQAKKFKAQFVATADQDKYADLKEQLAGCDIKCGAGKEAVLEAASLQTDTCMAAIVGVAGLEPTLTAIQSAKTVALANKECLVSAGKLFMQTVKENNTILIPVDSEHSGAYQCLAAEQSENIQKLTLTASGGPFRNLSKQELQNVTKAQALQHPNWEMGAKITIDSATLMNKGLELIEAKYLFSLKADQLDMVIHPQSIIHCLVSLKDGSMLAQMSEPDMRVPISYSLAWPQRLQTPVQPVDLADIGQLTFEKPDIDRFSCLALAKHTLYNTQTLGPILNAANEIAVEAFLAEKISFTAIAEVIEQVMETMDVHLNSFNPMALNDILQIDHKARYLALELLKLRV